MSEWTRFKKELSRWESDVRHGLSDLESAVRHTFRPKTIGQMMGGANDLVEITHFDETVEYIEEHKKEFTVLFGIAIATTFLPAMSENLLKKLTKKQVKQMLQKKLEKEANEKIKKEIEKKIQEIEALEQEEFDKQDQVNQVNQVKENKNNKKLKLSVISSGLYFLSKTAGIL